jgi:hypothetical protein
MELLGKMLDWLNAWMQASALYGKQTGCLASLLEIAIYLATASKIGAAGSPRPFAR